MRVAPGESLTLVSANGRLTSVDVYITAYCNRRCTYCFLPAEFFASGARMSMDGFAGVVRWSRRHGVGEITLLGGEPSLHPSFAAMASHASSQGLSVRVVTNGARRFQRLLSSGAIGPHNLSRVAVSLDTLAENIQDRYRGPRAWQDAMAAIRLMRDRAVPFDINVTAIKPVIGGLDELIDFAEREGCRRVNIHWPSAMGIGGVLSAGLIPARPEWEALVRRIAARVAQRPGFFVEIERGFLSSGAALAGCALDDFSNLQVFPDGRAYRCGLLVDQAEMASLSMVGDTLRLTRPGNGEELLRSAMSRSCDACPVIQAEERRACIYDKVRSIPRLAKART
jgi:MoaA/NifB/PqqE/SkfB family radical SAM enzyme